jgi:hypothetical protein
LLEPSLEKRKVLHGRTLNRTAKQAYFGVDPWKVSQELGGHSVQGIPGPLAEPVNGGAVHQAGELAQPFSEVPSHWAEAQHHVQVALHLHGKSARNEKV